MYFPVWIMHCVPAFDPRTWLWRLILIRLNYTLRKIEVLPVCYPGDVIIPMIWNDRKANSRYQLCISKGNKTFPYRLSICQVSHYFAFRQYKSTENKIIIHLCVRHIAMNFYCFARKSVPDTQSMPGFGSIRQYQRRYRHHPLLRRSLKRR